MMILSPGMMFLIMKFVNYMVILVFILIGKFQETEAYLVFVGIIFVG